MRYLLGALDADLRGAGELARLEAVTDSFAEAYDAARWAISRRAPGSPDVQTLLGAERRDRYDEGAPDMRFTAHDESYALADYPLTAEVMEAGGGFAIEAADRARTPTSGRCSPSGASRRSRPPRRSRPDGSAWLVELYSDPRTHALPAALPELRLLAGEAVGRGPGGGYAPPVTSEAKSSKTST